MLRRGPSLLMPCFPSPSSIVQVCTERAAWLASQVCGRNSANQCVSRGNLEALWNSTILYCNILCHILIRPETRGPHHFPLISLITDHSVFRSPSTLYSSINTDMADAIDANGMDGYEQEVRARWRPSRILGVRAGGRANPS